MSRKRAEESSEELVYVVDLTTTELERAEEEIHSKRQLEPPPLPEEPPREIEILALLIDGREEPLFLPIEPTRDVLYLDALARLLRIAALAGETLSSVAINYGEAFERSLAFERRLPTWAYDGVDRDVAVTLPRELQLVLAPKKRVTPKGSINSL